MAMFENFPYTNLHELNLDWLIKQLNQMTEAQVLSVNGMTGVVTLYENAAVQFPAVAQDSWQIVRLADGTTRGIYFANDNKAFILHGNTMSEIYSQNNQPPYPVTRVNGKYGDIELYTDQYVRLPDLTDAQMTNWTFFRMLNNVSHGIQFDDDGTASIINGVHRYVLYTSNNPPTFPVDSVNGQTGTVVLYTDVNAAVGFPAVTDADINAWSLERNVNGTVYGLRLNDDGTVTLKVGAAEYTVYTSNDPQDGYVTDPENSVQQITEDSTDNYWGLIRDTTEGSIGLLFENSDPDDPSAYVVYTDSNDQQQRMKILTPADIPASGVVSVNTKTGIVTLYGSDIEVNSGDSRKVNQAISDTEAKVAFIEPTSTASRNYNENQFLITNNTLYEVTAPITSGDSLTVGTNIELVNNLGERISSLIGTTYNLNMNKADRWGPGVHTLYSQVKCSGCITANNTRLHFFYPVPCRAGLTGSNLTTTYLTARGVGGYILNSISDLTPYTVTIRVMEEGINIQLDTTGTFGTNNTPVEVDIDGTITLS